MKKIFQSGVDAWYAKENFTSNPYHIWYDEDKFQAWSDGWWHMQDEMYKDEHQKYLIELAKEERDLEHQRELKAKSKTAKGRAELAGQSTLF